MGCLCLSLHQACDVQASRLSIYHALEHCVREAHHERRVEKRGQRVDQRFDRRVLRATLEVGYGVPEHSIGQPQRPVLCHRYRRTGRAALVLQRLENGGDVRQQQFLRWRWRWRRHSGCGRSSQQKGNCHGVSEATARRMINSHCPRRTQTLRRGQRALIERRALGKRTSLMFPKQEPHTP